MYSPTWFQRHKTDPAKQMQTETNPCVQQTFPEGTEEGSEKTTRNLNPNQRKATIPG